MNHKNGILIISLDFELYWGVRDKVTIEQYEKNLQGVRRAVQEMLSMFCEYDIHATWAIVGFLFFEDIDTLKKNFPKILPNYADTVLSPYKYINDSVKLDFSYHFAPDLIDIILTLTSKGQEIGTHTFSHYFCLEKGQSSDAFKEDIYTAMKVAKNKGIHLKSLVFPRNQYNLESLQILHELGIKCYRGNEKSIFYKAANTKEFNFKIRRAFRLLDSYINLGGHHTYDPYKCIWIDRPFNIPSSRYLRPYTKKFSFLDSFRLKRITKAMDEAALNHKVFHIWWHPHNFGNYVYENISFLKKILEHFSKLRKIYGMESLNMSELSNYLEEIYER
jgi:peptidoglycan/xylan/chitin deacetylase (PgdA/CDA1 family)